MSFQEKSQYYLFNILYYLFNIQSNRRQNRNMNEIIRFNILITDAYARRNVMYSLQSTRFLTFRLILADMYQMKYESFLTVMLRR